MTIIPKKSFVLSQTVFLIAVLLLSFVGDMWANEQGVLGNTGIGEKNRLVIFIHGFKGDATETWKNKDTGKTWPELLAQDPDFKSFVVDSYSYRTSCESDGLNIEELSTQFAERLRQEFKVYDEIYIVAHSMGGVISLRAIASIEPRFPQDVSKIKGVFLMGVPFKGTNVFETFFGGIYDAFCKSKQLPDLKRDISYLDQLDNEWARIANREFPKIFAAFEKKAYLGHIIVPKDSIFPVRGDPKCAIDKNHVDMVKPADTQDFGYRWVKDKIRDIRNGINKAEEAEDKQNKSSFSAEAYLMRPILQLLLAPNEDIGVKMRDDSHGFYLPFVATNLGKSTATNVKVSHMFFNYPPDFEDKTESDVFDVIPNRGVMSPIIMHIKTEHLLASVNFFHYQNIITILQWQSDNPIHNGVTFQQARWWRLFYNPLGKSDLVPVKSRFYTWHNISENEAFNKGFSEFIKDETLTKAYDLKEYFFDHKGK